MKPNNNAAGDHAGHRTAREETRDQAVKTIAGGKSVLQGILLAEQHQRAARRPIRRGGDAKITVPGRGNPARFAANRI